MSVLELGCGCRCRVLLERAAAGQGAGQGAAVRVLCVLCFACFALGSGAACWVLVPLQGAASMCCCHSAVCVWLVPLQGATGGCCCQSAVRARKRNCVLPTYLLLSGAYAGIISKVFFPKQCVHTHTEGFYGGSWS